MDLATSPAVARWSRTARLSASAVMFRVDGRPVLGFEGECLAIALGVAGVLTLRRSPVDGTPRGLFCLMGVCQECVVAVDGHLVPSCLEMVRADMEVVTDRLTRQCDGTLHD